MTYVPIERVDIESYGCIEKASFALSPLHALIGPNDSGKSTVLRALRTLMQQLAEGFILKGAEVNPFDPWIYGASKNAGAKLALVYRDGYTYSISVSDEIEQALQGTDGDVVRAEVGPRLAKGLAAVVEHAKMSLSLQRFTVSLVDGIPTAKMEDYKRFMSRVSLPTMVRFDPDFLRAPAALIPDNQGIAFADERGAGLAGVFDAIINRDQEAFVQIQTDVRSLFPCVAKVGLINVSNALKEIAVTLADGTRVGAKAMSEGLLYYLGFAALKYIDGSNLFLIEEPENGLHPARIAEVMTALREISKTSQVVIATHSPLVVNELDGHEVTVVTRDPATGTQAVLLKDVPGFEDASKIYQPGELWVSYCDGDREEPLLTGRARA